MDAQNRDPDPQETQEWVEALEAVLAVEGPDRAHELIERIILVDRCALGAGSADDVVPRIVTIHIAICRNYPIGRAELHIGEAMPHGGFSGDTPEDLELVAELARFLDKHRRH